MVAAFQNKHLVTQWIQINEFSVLNVIRLRLLSWSSVGRLFHAAGQATAKCLDHLHHTVDKSKGAAC